MTTKEKYTKYLNDEYFVDDLEAMLMTVNRQIAELASDKMRKEAGDKFCDKSSIYLCKVRDGLSAALRAVANHLDYITGG